MSNLRFLRLLVFWLLACISANGSTINRGYEGCLHYLETLDGLLLFVKQKIVNRSSFCQAVEFYAANGCFSHGSSHEDDRRTVEQFCSKDFPQIGYVQTNQLRGRKLLLHSLAAPPNSSKFSRHAHLSLAPGKFTIAVPIAFFLCCAFLCPCFRAKRRAVSEEVKRPNELHTMDSVSSMDMSTRSDRIPESPYHVPPSPLRASSSRFSLSQNITRARLVHLSFSHIVKATQNFSPVHLIGEGGFGAVYKAQLPDGQVVAVKRAKKASFLIEQSQFNNEVELLSKIEHRSLVRLLDCIDEGNERLIITEYVPNGTLREHLDGQHGRILDFSHRLEISIDVAHALTYLHLYAEKPIIHRDVKSSNILLTKSFRAKVADFGFARGGSMDEDKTHVSTKVKGTFGYLDPEYLKTNQLTPRSDVYSFGILLVEILSGRRPVETTRPSNERITVRWAFGKFTEGEVAEILDPALGEVDKELVAKMLALAFQCAAPVRNDRPTMKETVESLWEIRREYGSLGRG